MFVLEEGEVVVEVPGRTYSCEPGEFFGELALLAPGLVRTARVRATTPVRCLAISRISFAELLEAEPQIAVAMLPASRSASPTPTPDYRGRTASANQQLPPPFRTPLKTPAPAGRSCA